MRTCKACHPIGGRNGAAVMNRAASPERILTVRLGGGLGNQLFQYAFGRRLSMVNQARLLLDATGYDDDGVPDAERGVRILGLDHFAIVGTLVRRIEAPRAPRNWISRKFRKYWGKAVDLLESRKPYYLRRRVEEPVSNHFRFDARLYNREIRGRVSLYGYWQTEKYFADIEATIRRELAVRDELEGPNAELAAVIRSTNSVSIHVRHGDNATTETALGVLPLSYFSEAIQNIVREIADPHFFVFSDDICWARDFLVLRQPTTFVEHNGDIRNYEDLRLMSYCRHQILSNSTFSWWGAWLGKKEGQIVYAPRRYYQNIDRPNPDLYPAAWRLI